MISLIFPAMAVVFAAWFCAAWIRAELPKKGTLEWIFAFEKPRFAVEAAFPLRLSDLFWWLIPAAVAAAALVAEVLLTVGAASVPDLIMQTVPPVMAAAAVYFLTKSMTGSVISSLAGGCLTALSAILLGEETVLFAVAVFAAWLWFAGGAWWLLALAGAALAAAATFDPLLALFAPVLLIVAIVGASQRVREDRLGAFGAIVTVLLPFLAAAVTLPLTFTPAGLSFGMGFPQCYGRADFWGMIVGYYAAAFPILPLGGVHPWSFFFAALTKLPAIALTVCGLVVPLVQFCRRKSGAALYLWLWCAAAAVLFVFDVDCTAITGAMVLAYGTSRLLRRGHPVRASIAMTISLAAAAAAAATMILVYLSIV